MGEIQDLVKKGQSFLEDGKFRKKTSYDKEEFDSKKRQDI